LKCFFTIIATVFIASTLWAQQGNGLVKKGNDEYKKGDLKAATDSYRKALAKDKDNKAAQFNLGNALEKQSQATDAEKEYNELLNSNANTDLKSKASYNKGLSLIQQKKFPEAADAFKQSLKINPEDNDARENLQKALNEIKKQQEQQNQQQQKKEQKKQKEDQKQQQQQQPQNKTKLSMQKAEQLLNQLRDKEKQLQNQLQKQKPNTQQQEKDW